MGCKAILLNGPPRCGKDTIGLLMLPLLQDFAPRLDKFAYPIRQMLSSVYGIEIDEVPKDSPHSALLGRTPREVAIAYSERYCKPLWGQDYFGKQLGAHLEHIKFSGVSIVTDSGFVHEAEALVGALGTGNVLQVKVDRPGTDFNLDSRSYWTSPRIGSVKFLNDQPNLALLNDKLRRDLLPQVLEWLRK